MSTGQTLRGLRRSAVSDLSDIGARDVTARVTMVPDINERALNSRVAQAVAQVIA